MLDILLSFFRIFFFWGGGAQISSLPPGTRYPRYATDRSAKMNTGKEWLHSGACPGGGGGGAGGLGPTLIIEKPKKGLSDFRPPPLTNSWTRL